MFDAKMIFVPSGEKKGAQFAPASRDFFSGCRRDRS
jgi:hypothetical protein